jgi:hypothetical protein
MARRQVLWSAAIVCTAVAAFGLYWFAPWRALTTTTVTDQLPSVAATSAAPTGPAAASPAPSNRVIAQGSFVTHAHTTRGAVQIVRLADGRHQLIIRDLRTSDGPDVRVWLSDQPVPTTGPFDIYGQGRHVELGLLKGNVGDLVYDIPATVDFTAYASVDLWCKRFSVSFGAASLHPVS